MKRVNHLLASGALGRGDVRHCGQWEFPEAENASRREGRRETPSRILRVSRSGQGFRFRVLWNGFLGRSG